MKNAFGIACGFALLVALAAPAGAIFYPKAGPWMAGSDRTTENANFWRMYARDNDNRQLMYGYARIALAAGSAAPVTMVTPDRSADAIPFIASRAQRQYFPGESVPDVIAYMRARVHEYARTVIDEGLEQRSVPVSCDYAVESMYDVGLGTHVEGDVRRNIRGTCVIMIAAMEHKGLLATNGQRQAFLQYLAIVGAAYREMDRRFAAAGDAASRTENAKQARLSFKQIVGKHESDLPPEHFPCLLENSAYPCERIMREGPPILAKIVEKYP